MRQSVIEAGCLVTTIFVQQVASDTALAEQRQNFVLIGVGCDFVHARPDGIQQNAELFRINRRMRDKVNVRIVAVVSIVGINEARDSLLIIARLSEAEPIDSIPE